MHQLKLKAIETFKLDESSFILSMGTSADFEEAVRLSMIHQRILDY